jgi:murein L,D-transpeptidase YcbB/YkuD
MNKTALRIGAAALALLFVSDLSLAASKDVRKRKTNIFTQIFGDSSGSTTNRRRNRALYGGDWFDDGRVRIIRRSTQQDPWYDTGPSASSSFADDGDPEGDPGFGLGNLTYVAPPTVAMGAIKLPDEWPAAAEAGAVYDALESKDVSLRVVAAIRDAVADHYLNHGFKPLWFVDGKFSARGEAVLKLLSKADAEGLDSASYLPPSLASFEAAPPVFDPAAMAAFDIELTALAVKYARDASGGRFDPERLSRYHDIAPPTIDAAKAMQVLAWSPYAAEYLESLQPTHPAYGAFKAELAKLRSETPAPFEGIESGEIIRTGQTDQRLPAIRQRLADLGFAQALEASGDMELMDADLAVQVRLFQKSAGIGADGLIGNQTIKALNVDHSQQDVARLLDNMERLRWLPRQLGNRYVMVNQAAFQVRVMNNGQAEWTSRVIVGKPSTQTVVFNDEIEMVVFNPSWGVPPSIIANEYLPKLRRDPSYLDRIGFKVTDARGRTVSSSSVDWYAYGNKVPFGIRQPPGGKNALGELKFLFPNSHNIYMHDTPTRNLFERDVRAFSHGCVRVQNPREFASVLLGWDADKVASNVESRRSETVKLGHKVPIYITYFTAWPDETGKIQYFNDIYGRDRTMDNARAGLTVAQR